MDFIKKIINWPLQKLYLLFLWSSGADLDILEKAPTDKNKFYGIGGTIVFTALMATFAGGYAFFTAFKSPVLSVIFGLFWGALIFNLDRYIVSSFGAGDGKKTISGQEIKEAAPRLLMAIMLGFIIAIPLELKLFEREINAEISNEIAKVNATIVKTGEDDVVLARLNQEKRELEEAIQNRLDDIDSKRSEWQQRVIDKNDEWNTGKFSGKEGKGGYYEDLKVIAEGAEVDYRETRTQNTELNQRDYNRIDQLDLNISQRIKSTTSEVEEQKTIQQQNDGLIARLKALDRLSYEEVPVYEMVEGERQLVEVKTEKTVVWYAKWLITILFVFIEIAPILFKMMTERGPYDDILDRIKHKTKVKQLLLQSNLNQEINMAVRIHNDKTNQKLETEISANEALLKSIAAAQAEIAEIAIEEWKKQQKKKVKENPGVMIKS